jgi:hypothetical protein
MVGGVHPNLLLPFLLSSDFLTVLFECAILHFLSLCRLLFSWALLLVATEVENSFLFCLGDILVRYLLSGFDILCLSLLSR